MIGNEQEILYAIALTRLSWSNMATTLFLFQQLGGAKAVYDHRNDIRDVLPECSSRLAEALRDWQEPLARAERELAFMEKHSIQALCLGDDRYPQRLANCPDAPVVLYYMGTADLNQRRVIDIVGTRHCTSYGADLIRRFMADLRELCPEVLVVSGLAYGVDICAHRNALQNGYETVGILAHGLDYLYPPRHRDTAKEMLAHGGLLTEYMSETKADKVNFVRRNRIVAGISDATILVESAAKGGGLITTSIALDYNRAVFAFPGAVGTTYSEGCNNLIRDNGAQLITSASDFVAAMGWQTDAQLRQALRQGIERQCFPELTAEEQTVVQTLSKTGDLQLNQLSVKVNMGIGQLTALLFQLEMKGVVRPLAGGTYHLLL
ncbi:MAG: DNA-processing protein DprA [Prevotella sp.]|nr:DNA-processing protein DprA [Prevotella sp.]